MVCFAYGVRSIILSFLLCTIPPLEPTRYSLIRPAPLIVHIYDPLSLMGSVMIASPMTTSLLRFSNVRMWRLTFPIAKLWFIA